MKVEIFNFCPHKKLLKSYDGIMTKNQENDRGIDFWKYHFQKSMLLSFAWFFVMIPSYDFNSFLWGQKLNISSFVWATSEKNRSRELGDPSWSVPSVSCTPLINILNLHLRFETQLRLATHILCSVSVHHPSTHCASDDKLWMSCSWLGDWILLLPQGFPIIWDYWKSVASVSTAVFNSTSS